MTLFLYSVGMFVCGSILRTGNEVLQRRGRFSNSSPWVGLGELGAMVAMWCGWFRLCEVDLWHFSCSPWFQKAGAGLVALATFLVIGSATQLWLTRKPDGLVTQGFFAKLRHPMYLGFCVWLLGYPWVQASLTGLLLGGFGMLQVLMWRHWEDQRLRILYGQTFNNYRRGTIF